jgi:hypothetical protein
MPTTLDNINDATFALNAYSEAVKNKIINLQHTHIAPITGRNVTDLYTIPGISFIGGNKLGNSSAAVDNAMCVNTCFANSSCVGASYKNDQCQMYQALPDVGYSYDATSSLILYNRSFNNQIITALQSKLDALFGTKNVDGALKTSFVSQSSSGWDDAIDNLNDAKQTIADAEENKKMNKDVNLQLYNSGLHVIQTKTKYILFIVVFLLLLAFYVRDFNFSIFICIILFLIISVYGSIFLGAFLLVVIVLYLVYYAY